MNHDLLQKAREYEAQQGRLIEDAERPAFHLTPNVGWMNDPNGFSCFNGEYHLFYQYHPYSMEWGPMHWGHAKTRDFLHWERLPAALAPDQEYDKDGCFSGSAIELPDGRQMLVYTGVSKHSAEDGSITEAQTQCLAFGDGVNYQKWPGNPVLDSASLPAGGSTVDFRDPKVWREPDGSYRLVVGNRSQDGSGAVLLYRSEDGLRWSRVGVVDASQHQYGEMWECPDFFPLDGKQVLFVSPQEMQAMGLEFHPGNGTVCLIGSYDAETNHFVRESVQAIDYGIDFYAPQTLATPDGRRIMIGWMQNWNTLGYRPKGQRWFGQMSIPRELSLKNGRLIQKPIRELESYRRNRVAYQNVLLRGEMQLDGVEGRIIDMVVSIRPEEGETCRCFRIQMAKNDQYMTTLQYYPDTHILEIDRAHGGSTADVVHTRRMEVQPQNGVLQLRLLLDRYSAEIFVNDGETAATVAIFTPQEASAICFEAEGSLRMDVEKYEIDIDRKENQ